MAGLKVEDPSACSPRPLMGGAAFSRPEETRPRHACSHPESRYKVSLFPKCDSWLP